MKIEEIATPHHILEIGRKASQMILTSPQKYRESEIKYAELFSILVNFKSKHKFGRWFKKKYGESPKNFYKKKLKDFLEKAKNRNISAEIDTFLREHLLLLIILKEITSHIPQKELLENLMGYVDSLNLRLLVTLIKNDIPFKELEELLLKILSKNSFEEKIYSVYITWYLGAVYEEKKRDLLFFHYKFLKSVSYPIYKEGLLKIEKASPTLRVQLIKLSLILHLCSYDTSLALNKLETINYVKDIIDEKAATELLLESLEKALYLEIPKIKISLSYKWYITLMCILSGVVTFQFYFRFLPLWLWTFCSTILTTMLVHFLWKIWKLRKKVIEGVKYGR